MKTKEVIIMWMVLLILMGLYFFLGIASHLCNIFSFFEDRADEKEKKKEKYVPNKYKLEE